MLEKGLDLFVDGLGIHAQTQHEGALNLKYRKFACQPVPESRGTYRRGVVVAENDAARFDHGKGLVCFCGEAGHPVAGIAEDHLRRSAIGPIIPGFHAGEDLLDSGLDRLIPIEKADFVLAGNGRKIESDDFSVRWKVQGNVDGGTTFRSAKFDHAFRLQVVHHLRKNDQFLRKYAEIPWKRKEQLERAGAVHFREKFFELSHGDFEIVPPGRALPFVGQAESRIQMVRVREKAEGGRGTALQQNAERIEVEGRKSAGDAPE